MIEERAAVMCSDRMRSTVAKKAGPPFPVGGHIEDVVTVEVTRGDGSLPFSITEPDGESSGEVRSRLQGVLLVPGLLYPVPAAGL